MQAEGMKNFSRETNSKAAIEKRFMTPSFVPAWNVMPHLESLENGASLEHAIAAEQMSK